MSSVKQEAVRQLGQKQEVSGVSPMIEKLESNGFYDHVSLNRIQTRTIILILPSRVLLELFSCRWCLEHHIEEADALGFASIFQSEAIPTAQQRSMLPWSFDHSNAQENLKAPVNSVAGSRYDQSREKVSSFAKSLQPSSLVCTGPTLIPMGTSEQLEPRRKTHLSSTMGIKSTLLCTAVVMPSSGTFATTERIFVLRPRASFLCLLLSGFWRFRELTAFLLQ
ncbi:hypothetical protein BBP40_005465 [Aspergillus hancockii]|nr:hypothetical protein BBP40_005465 [Aspergillus hancockii]